MGAMGNGLGFSHRLVCVLDLFSVGNCRRILCSLYLSGSDFLSNEGDFKKVTHESSEIAC